MTPLTHNPILAVETLGHATPLRDAAEYAGWATLDRPTPRELLRALFLRSHRVVVVGIGGSPAADAHDLHGTDAGRLLEALHASSHPARVVASVFGTNPAAEQRARAQGVALCLNNPTPHQLIDAAQSLLPGRRPAVPTAPIADKHPAPADPAIAPRAHLVKLMAHPPPARFGPRRRKPA